jgi:hypothetical protein
MSRLRPRLSCPSAPLRRVKQKRSCRPWDPLRLRPRYGTSGHERMKKDPIIGIINTQSNSPGAIQQVGVGEFSQSAFVQHHQQLVAAIDRALASPEFQQLQQAQREGFRDIADVVKGEATKPSPDPSKLKRWSERLLGMGREIGMRMAVSEIGQAIAHIFGSAV